MDTEKRYVAVMQTDKPINLGLVEIRDDGFIKKAEWSEDEWTPIEDYGNYMVRPVADGPFPATGSEELFQMFLQIIGE